MTYLLITPARNEEKYLHMTIESVVKQSVLPQAWVIVSDGSTDDTDDIIKKYSKKYSFIRYHRMGEDEKRNFKSKAFAFNKGYRLIRELQHDYVGNLDADVSFDEHYFEIILTRMEAAPLLGIGGGIIRELINGVYIPQNISDNSVAGAVQLFKKKCFEDIGGYIPLYGGGIDSAAEITARAKGWNVRTFKDIEVMHHRRVVTGNKNKYMNSFKIGINRYVLGYHPLFHFIGSLSKLHTSPVIVGSLLSITGFLWASMRRYKKALPIEVVNYLKREQISRLFSLLRFSNSTSKSAKNTNNILGR